MTFEDFRFEFEKQLDMNCFKITYPKNTDSKYFWITVIGTGIGSELCHYEFIHDGTKLNLEIHFEFGTSGDYQAVTKLLSIKLFNKQISLRYPFNTNSHQAGINYKTFDLNSKSIIKDTLRSLKRMNKKFQKELPKLLSYFCKKKIDYNYYKTYDKQILSEETIYKTVIAISFLFIILFPVIIVFLTWIKKYQYFSIIKKFFMFTKISSFCISLALLIITCIVCLTIISIKMLKHIITQKKLNLLAQMESENISEENVKSFVNAITDL